MPFSTAKLTIVVAVITVLLGALLFLDQYNIVPLSQLPGLSHIAPTPTPKSTSNVLFPPNYDPSGRDIYYYTVDIETLIPYSGVGVFKSDQNPEIIRYIVGSFVGWEDIPNSPDKYLILKDRYGVGGGGKPAEIPKIRVGFNPKVPDPSPVETNSINTFATNFLVEDLNSVVPKTIDLEKRTSQYLLGHIGSFTQKQVNILIKKGDAIAVKVYLDSYTKKDMIDSNKNIIASDLLIRRFNPKTQLVNELGAQINIK